MFLITIKSQNNNREKWGGVRYTKEKVNQGDPLSSIIFNNILEEVFRRPSWEGKDVRVNGEYISNLKFADDLVIIAKEEDELLTTLEELNEDGKNNGLGIVQK